MDWLSIVLTLLFGSIGIILIEISVYKYKKLIRKRSLRKKRKKINIVQWINSIEERLEIQELIESKLSKKVSNNIFNNISEIETTIGDLCNHSINNLLSLKAYFKTIVSVNTNEAYIKGAIALFIASSSYLFQEMFSSMSIEQFYLLAILSIGYTVVTLYKGKAKRVLLIEIIDNMIYKENSKKVGRA